MTIPDFHTFREMVEHVEGGGAAYRYGSHYPIYCKSQYLHTGPIEKRFDGGSSGECLGKAEFSVEEQNSTNWVLISKEDWEAREEAMHKAYEECARINAENRKRELAQGPPKPAKKSNWFGL